MADIELNPEFVRALALMEAGERPFVGKIDEGGVFSISSGRHG